MFPPLVVHPWVDAPSSEAFLVFNSVWSLLVLAYIGFVPLYYTRFFHRLASLGLLALTTLFWFAGAIAFAAFIGTPACHGSRYCGTAKASAAFAFFIWLFFSFLLTLDTLEALRKRPHDQPGGATVAMAKGQETTVVDA